MDVAAFMGIGNPGLIVRPLKSWLIALYKPHSGWYNQKMSREDANTVYN